MWVRTLLADVCRVHCSRVSLPCFAGPASPEILCVSGMQMDNQIVVSDYTQMDRVLREERTYILNMVKQIKKAGCNVLLIQKSILRYTIIQRNYILWPERQRWTFFSTAEMHWVTSPCIFSIKWRSWWWRTSKERTLSSSARWQSQYSVLDPY